MEQFFEKNSMDDGDSSIIETQSQEVVEKKQLLQPPTGQFQNREELLEHVRSFALVQGYATSIKTSKKDKYVIIKCDRGGAYRNRTNIPIEHMQRKMGSRLINCPFEVRGKRQNDGSWIIEVRNGEHNHEASIDMSGHPSCRRFSKEETLRIKEMTMSGIQPRQILSSLRQSNPNLRAISRTVYYTKGKIRKDNLSGRTVLQALFEELANGGFTYDIKCNAQGHLTHLFFAHPASIALSKSYSNIFMMDCTYKTNRYKMRLLDIVGVTSFNSSFYSCFAFLKEEEPEDFVWALKIFSNMLATDTGPLVIISNRELALMKAIHVVFPTTTNLLSVWHIEKNILSNCKHHFKGDDWNSFLSAWTTVIDTPTESSFLKAWQDFEVQYKEKPIVLNYIRSTWLPLKDKFVKAWTEKHQHFGNHVTSRAEGAHANLKRYLQVSTGDLQEVKNKISLAIENQFQEIKAQLSNEKIRIPHNCCVPIFKEIVTHVSIFALKELLKQYQLTKSDLVGSPCKNHFTTTMGLPCAHKLRERGDSPLHLSDVHQQWRIDIRSFNEVDAGLKNIDDEVKGLLEEFQRKYQQWPLSQKEAALKQLSQLVNTSTPMLYEPNVQSHKRCPSRSKKRKTVSTTMHDPSAFETAEKSTRCGVCNNVGHTSRTCQREAIELNSPFPMSDSWQWNDGENVRFEYTTQHE